MARNVYRLGMRSKSPDPGFGLAQELQPSGGCGRLAALWSHT